VDIRFNPNRHSPVQVAVEHCKAFAAQNPVLQGSGPDASVELTADCVFPLMNHLQRYYTVAQLERFKTLSEYSTISSSSSSEGASERGRQSAADVDTEAGGRALQLIGFATPSLSLSHTARDPERDILTEILMFDLSAGVSCSYYRSTKQYQ
jgi:hypothetical protein